MIKVNCNDGIVNVENVSGSGVQVMSELCCIVDAVCTGWCSDEEESIRDNLKGEMIRTVAHALAERNLFE